MLAPNGEKINRKRLEHLERIKRKNEIKTSKSKIKKLAKIAERKKLKQTRDSLIEKLSEFQHTSFTNLIPTAKMHLKDYQPQMDRESTSKNLKASVKFPRKLRCVSGVEKNSASKREQANYYETGSSCSDEEPVNIISSKPLTDASANSDVVILDELKTEIDDYAEENSISVKKSSKKKASLNSKKITISKNIDIVNVDEDGKDVVEEKTLSTEFFQSLVKIKGAQIAVPRLEVFEAQRRKLPIHAEEQQIVESINENTVILICGETGSGKTTQIPQFLYEAGYTSNGHLIGVTEPRRIAAITMAERVGRELCAPELSSYQIRFEGNRTEKTKILFMTDGVLLRELQSDVTLSRFSVIVIDEAHERSVYSDVLIGLLSRICVARLRRGFPLKLIIMSATLRLSDFLQERLFPKIKPKVLKVEARQFPVTLHFERCTPRDYLKAAFYKICKIHERLPEGGILVFVSGQREVEQLIKWLTLKFPTTTKIKQVNGNGNIKSKKIKKLRRKTDSSSLSNKNVEIGEDMVVDYEEFGAADADKAQNSAEISEDMNEMFLDELQPNDENEKFPPLHCLPLYSLMSSEKQREIFKPIPKGSRLCIVATNVAETSLTIPNIRYVVDSGKEKCRHFDPITGVSRFSVEWISRASADQRSGRAGRVQAGHAYRLYSSAVYEDFVKFAVPDILNQSVEQLVLHLKAMNFTKLLNFPFPTPPAPDQIEAAERRLIHLGALEKNSEGDARITPFGKTLAQIPLAPPFANLLARSNRDGLMPYAIAIVATLSVREPLVSIAELRRNDAVATQDAMAQMLVKRRAWCALGEAHQLGDLCVLLHLIGAADNEPQVTSKFLAELGLRSKPYFEICRLRRQLVNVVNESTSLKEKFDADNKLSPPNQTQMQLIRELMAKSLPDNIAKRVDRTVDNSEIPKGAYKCQRLEEFVFIDSTSMLYKDQPDYVLYHEVVELGQKKCMQNISVVEEHWIPQFAKSKLNS